MENNNSKKITKEEAKKLKASKSIKEKQIVKK